MPNASLPSTRATGGFSLRSWKAHTVDVRGDDGDVAAAQVAQQVATVLQGKDGHAKDGAHCRAHDFGVVEFDRAASEKDARAGSGFGCPHDHAQVAGVRDAVEDEERAVGVENGFAVPCLHGNATEHALRGVRVRHAFEGAPVGLLNGDALGNRRLVEVCEALVAGDALAAKDELLERGAMREGFFAQAKAFDEVFSCGLPPFSAFEAQDSFRVLTAMGLGGVVFAEGGAQVLQGFPDRFFAFGQAQKVDRDDDPDCDVSRGHVFEVLHPCLLKVILSGPLLRIREGW